MVWRYHLLLFYTEVVYAKIRILPVIEVFMWGRVYQSRLLGYERVICRYTLSYPKGRVVGKRVGCAQAVPVWRDSLSCTFWDMECQGRSVIVCGGHLDLSILDIWCRLCGQAVQSASGSPTSSDVDPALARSCAFRTHARLITCSCHRTTLAAIKKKKKTLRRWCAQCWRYTDVRQWLLNNTVWICWY